MRAVPMWRIIFTVMSVGFLLSLPGWYAVDVPDPSTSGSITLTANTPYISAYDLLINGTSTSVLNTQLDVGIIHAFRVNVTEVSAGGGFPLVQYVNISAWYDWGRPLDDAGSDRYNFTLGGNTNLRFIYDNTSGAITGGSFSMLWPRAQEVTFLGGSEIYIDGNNRTLEWYFTPLHFFRWAPGDIDSGDLTWTAPVDPTVITTAFNDRNSWNFNISVDDSLNNTATVWDEFGVFRYSAMLLAAGTIPSGTGYPGGPRFGLSGDGDSLPTNFSYRSNGPHRFTVDTTDITKGGDTIAASELAVAGGEISPESNFLGPIIDQYIWGNATQYRIHNFTNFSAGPPVGPWNSTDLAYSAGVPAATPGGTYTGTLTYSVDVNTDPNSLAITPPPVGGGPPLPVNLRAGDTVVGGGSGNVLLISTADNPVGNLVQLRYLSNDTVIDTFLIGAGTNSGPPLFLQLDGEFDTTVTVDSALLPFSAYLRSFDAPTTALALECGDSGSFIISGGGPFDIPGWSHVGGCVP